MSKIGDAYELRRRAAACLRTAGTRFAFVHGSVAEGETRSDSDLDVAAWWGAAVVGGGNPLGGVDLLVLDDALLELAGRVALRGERLFDEARVLSQLDELEDIRAFVAALSRF